MKKCPVCGKAHDGNFCPNGCNSPQYQNAHPQATHPRKRGLRGWQIALIVIAAVFAPIVTLGVFLEITSTPDASSVAAAGPGEITSSHNQSNGQFLEAPSSATPTTPTTRAPEYDYEIDASVLYDEYNRNEIAADAKYKNKKLQITGVINNIGSDIMGSVYITLSIGEEYSITDVQCYFDSKAEIEKVSTLEKGQTVTLLGVGDGKTFNVLVKKCKIVE